MRLPDAIDCMFEHPSADAAQVLLPMVYNIGNSEFPASENILKKRVEEITIDSSGIHDIGKWQKRNPWNLGIAVMC